MQRLFSTAAIAAATALVLVSSASGAQSEPSPSAAPPPQELPAPPVTRALQPTSSEDAHVAIRPCRIVDTRAGGGVVPGGTTRELRLRGTTRFADQGGTPGGCGIPESATSVTASVSVLGHTHDGFLRAWPSGTPQPNATLVNYQSGEATTNSTDLMLGTGDMDVAVRPSATTHVVIDVLGYFAPPIHATVSNTGALYANSSRVLSSTKTGVGEYLVIVDRDLDGCSVEASTWPAHFTAGARIDGNRIHGYTTSLLGEAPAPIDIYWHFAVHC
jgi:hypothetical protein